MTRKRYSSEQIISMLHEAEVLLNKGASVIEVSRKLGIAEPSQSAIFLGKVDNLRMAALTYPILELFRSYFVS